MGLPLNQSETEQKQGEQIIDPIDQDIEPSDSDSTDTLTDSHRVLTRRFAQQTGQPLVPLEDNAGVPQRSSKKNATHTKSIDSIENKVDDQSGANEQDKKSDGSKETTDESIKKNEHVSIDPDSKKGNQSSTSPDERQREEGSSSQNESNIGTPDQRTMAAGTKTEFETIVKAFGLHPGVRITGEEPLTHTNYKKWSQRIGSHLRYYQLFSLIDREWSDEVKALPMYRHMNDVCLDQIKNSCTDYYLLMVEDETDCKEAWKTFKTHFQGSKLVQAINAMRELSATIQRAEHDLVQVLINFKNHSRDLKALCPTFPDLLLIGLLAAMVPKSAEGTVKSLMMSKSDANGDPKISLDETVQMFHNDLHLRNSQKPSDKMRSVCAVTSETAGKREEPNKLKCLYCQKPGHPLKECRAYKADLATGKAGPIVFNSNGNKRFKKAPSNSEAAGSQTNPGGTNKKNSGKEKKTYGCALVFNANTEGLNPNSIVLDSGCANRHAMKSLRGCVKRYTGYESPVYTASKHPLPTNGSGDFELTSISSGCKLRVNNAVKFYVVWPARRRRLSNDRRPGQDSDHLGI